MKSSPNKRLKEALDELNLPYGQIANEAGIARNTLYDLIKEGASIKHNYLLDLNKKFGIDYEFILSGKKKLTSRVEEDYVEYLSIDDEFTRIPYLRGVKAGAGFGLIEEAANSHHIAFRHYFVKNTLRSNASDLIALRIGGDSMAPLMVDGDDILVDRARKTVKEGPAFLIRIDEEIFVKFLTKLPGQRLKVWSKNRAFESFEVSTEDMHFEVLGQVVWHAHVSEYL